ncbi:hypothetical protein BGW36DRAFT_10590 [Talaromyces proteolyticus]|uniref:Uncharacterized protein n=1 Tax=Talaromyces proteolyticus TaxID=1131652 RepID=A0AAD4Q6E6_9EURO|nr:uncharacterized protein BGW36DRAFT_10590 [Talaromyces proteolyticus]KAH8705267.1 hypothetical protein BGW36DRAFT_10590 [Talaromyces proteolyticus]
MESGRDIGLYGSSIDIETMQERISLAVRAHEIPGNIEIFLSGNEPAGTSTIERLAKVWKDLGHLSAGFFRPRLLKKFKPTSHCHLPKRMTSKVEEFRLDALKWSFTKIQKRVQSPQHQFLIDTKVPNEKQPLAKVQKAVMELQPFFTGKEAECENPPDNDDSYWWRIWKLLATIRSAYKKLIFPKDDEAKPPLDRDTERYIRKANNLLHHLKVVLRAATSTNLAHLFQFDIRITVVDDGRHTIFRGPDSAWAWAWVWAWVFEHAVRCYNEKMGKCREWLSLVDGWEDSIKALAEQRIDHEELTVHPELKMLLHCAKENGNGAHIFTYIATSKPSCLPCMSFFQGFNFPFGSQFVVYGSDWKIHWSWRFPPDCPNGEAVLGHI